MKSGLNRTLGPVATALAAGRPSRCSGRPRSRRTCTAAGVSCAPSGSIAFAAPPRRPRPPPRLPSVLEGPIHHVDRAGDSGDDAQRALDLIAEMPAEEFPSERTCDLDGEYTVDPSAPPVRSRSMLRSDAVPAVLVALASLCPRWRPPSTLLADPTVRRTTEETASPHHPHVGITSPTSSTALLHTEPAVVPSNVPRSLSPMHYLERYGLEGAGCNTGETMRAESFFTAHAVRKRAKNCEMFARFFSMRTRVHVTGEVSPRARCNCVVLQGFRNLVADQLATRFIPGMRRQEFRRRSAAILRFHAIPERERAARIVACARAMRMRPMIRFGFVTATEGIMTPNCEPRPYAAIATPAVGPAAAPPPHHRAARAPWLMRSAPWRAIACAISCPITTARPFVSCATGSNPVYDRRLAAGQREGIHSLPCKRANCHRKSGRFAGRQPASDFLDFADGAYPHDLPALRRLLEGLRAERRLFARRDQDELRAIRVRNGGTADERGHHQRESDLPAHDRPGRRPRPPRSRTESETNPSRA